MGGVSVVTGKWPGAIPPELTVSVFSSSSIEQIGLISNSMTPEKSAEPTVV
jgi:hypothetical protein